MGCIWRRVKLFPKKRRIRGAILRQAYVFPWSRTTCTLPSENPRLSCLACVLHRFCGLRIYFAFRRCGNPRSRTTCTRPRAVLALLELLASTPFLWTAYILRVSSFGCVLFVRSRRKIRAFLVLLASCIVLTQYYLLASLSERKAYRLQPQFRIPHLQ